MKSEEYKRDEPRYRKLIVWQKAHKNALLIIRILKDCDIKYSRIINQCLAASTSIGANIAEGNSASTHRQKESYLRIALNSSYELDNWVQLLKDSRIVCSDLGSLLLIEKENIEVIKILSKIITSFSS